VANPRCLVNRRVKTLVLEGDVIFGAALASWVGSGDPTYDHALLAAGASGHRCIELNPRVIGAVDDHPLLCGCELVEWRVQVKTAMPGDRLGEACERIFRCEVGPGGDGAVAERAFGATDQECGAGTELNA